ncbi:MAG: hypothetical protein ACJ741_06980 [Pyrinomonadaceae bacterium]
MKYLRRVLLCLTTALLFFSAANSTRTQETTSDLHVQLSLADGKTVYRAGEPVRLVLSFTADRPGYQLNITTSQVPTSIDEIVLLPAVGATRWLEQYYGASRYLDYTTVTALSPKPIPVQLTLNDWVRFDEPGSYSVRIKTSRVSRPKQWDQSAPPIPLTTNWVSFEVKPMSEAEEAKEVSRLSALIDAAKNRQEEDKFTEELSYLTGDPSTREKVKRFLNTEGRFGNYYGNISHGLSMARNRPLIMKLLEQALRDPAAGVTHNLLGTLTTMRLVEEDGAAYPVPSGCVIWPEEPRRVTEIKQAYVRELAASLASRTGKSLRTTAMTILINLPKEKEQAAQALGVARPVLLREFENLHPFDQDLLLTAHWDQLRDPALAPALERMLSKPRGPRDVVSPAAALKRLLDLKPEAARPFFIREIVEPSPHAEFEVLRSLPDAELPEADAALLEQIRALAPLSQRGDFVDLRQKVLLAARYATAAIYGELLEIYKTWGAKWQADVRGSLLGYFLRYNEAEAIPLIEQALAESGSGQDHSLLHDMTSVNFSEGLDALLRRRLAGDDPQAAGTAAYIMSLHGAAADEKLIGARLERWWREWSPRAAELESGANLEQKMIEVNLVNALLDGKSWKLSEAEVEKIKQSCLTQGCRQRFPVR